MNRIPTVSFKSKPENWRKEYNGLKRNTVRKLDPDDKRYPLLMGWINGEFELNITIFQNVKGYQFTRPVSDVTFWEGIFIISWRDRG